RRLADRDRDTAENGVRTMTAATLRFDLEQARARTRWTMSVSVVSHALLFLCLVFHPVQAPDLAPITEITLLEPGDLAAAPAGSAPALATVQETRPGTETPAPARASDTTARRTVAGASITGPIVDRPIVSYLVPVYPEWAKHDAVEGAVTLYFVVRADGGVKENILVQKTAGFEDFDESARVALRVWRFRPLPSGQTGEQWGTTTFHFRLR